MRRNRRCATRSGSMDILSSVLKARRAPDRRQRSRLGTMQHGPGHRVHTVHRPDCSPVLNLAEQRGEAIAFRREQHETLVAVPDHPISSLSASATRARISRNGHRRSLPGARTSGRRSSGRAPRRDRTARRSGSRGALQRRAGRPVVPDQWAGHPPRAVSSSAVGCFADVGVEEAVIEEAAVVLHAVMARTGRQVGIGGIRLAGDTDLVPGTVRHERQGRWRTSIASVKVTLAPSRRRTQWFSWLICTSACARWTASAVGGNGIPARFSSSRLRASRYCRRVSPDPSLAGGPVRFTTMRKGTASATCSSIDRTVAPVSFATQNSSHPRSRPSRHRGPRGEPRRSATVEGLLLAMHRVIPGGDAALVFECSQHVGRSVDRTVVRDEDCRCPGLDGAPTWLPRCPPHRGP